MTWMDLLAMTPFLSLLVVALLILLMDAFGIKRSRVLLPSVACIATLGFAWPQHLLSDTAFNGLVAVDGFSFAFFAIILIGTFLTFLLNAGYMERQRAHTSGDVDSLILLCVCGGMVMVAASHLIVLFLGFELLSVSVYVLAGLAKKERASAEAALKYFILGAFSSAFLLYGMALIYGASGSLQIAEIAENVSSSNYMLLVGIGFLIFGFGFKVSLVPFHVWTPDVYQGAPVSISGFMAVVVKAAAFGSFLRVMYSCFGTVNEVWVGLLWVLCVLTMTIGNLVALRQQSIKRMLAYSSVAHAGYALIGFFGMGPAGGGEATIYYLLVYTFMTIAAFGVVLAVTAGSSAQYENDDIQSLAGIGWSHPFLGLVMTLSMLSLAGMPPTAGFIGKLYLFNAAVSSGYVGLAIIAALNSVVSLYYYLRVLVVMYFQGERKLSWVPPRSIEAAPAVALIIASLATIYLGIFSRTAYPIAEAAMQSL